MYFFAIAGYLVQEDSKKRGMNRTAIMFWSVAVVFFGLIFLPLYLLLRSRAVFAGDVELSGSESQIMILCPHCGERNPRSGKICSSCYKRMDIDAPSIGEKSCPFCGAMNPVESERCAGCGQVIGYIDRKEESD